MYKYKLLEENIKGYYLSSVSLTLFSLYIITQGWLFSSILDSSILQIITIVFIIFILLMKNNSKKKIVLHFSTFDLIWAIITGFLLINIINHGVYKNNNELFVYMTGFLLLIVLKVDVERYKSSFIILKLSSIIYAFSTFFHYFFTDAFHRIVFPFITINGKQRVMELVALNYYPGLGIAQPAIASGIIIIGIGITLSQLYFNKDNSKLTYLLVILILLMALVLIGKRSILMWCLLTMIVSYVVLWDVKDIIKNTFKFMLAIISFIISLILFLPLINSLPFFNRIIVTVEGLLLGEDVTSGRIVLYKRAWELFLENPIFGIGWGRFVEVTSGQLLSRDLIVHNVYLQILTELGIVGFVLVIFPLILIFIFTLNTFIKYKNSKIKRKWKEGLFFSVFYQLFFLLYCLTENPFYNIVYMFMYFYSLSILNSFNLAKVKWNIYE